MLKEFIRKIVKRHPELKEKLKKADSKYTPFQYVYNTLFLTGFTYVSLLILIFLMFKKDLYYLLFVSLGSLLFIPLIYLFFFGIIDVQIEKLKRELEADMMFVSEFFLVEINSGLPIGNIIENISRFDRPSGKFFKRIYLDFKTGVGLTKALNNAYNYSPSKKFRELIKKIKDSIEIGIDLAPILEDFLQEAADYNFLKIKEFAKSLNPLIMMYLLIGIVFPSLGVAIFIIGASVMNVPPVLLKLILVGIFMAVFLFQYMSFSLFKYKKDVIRV